MLSVAVALVIGTIEVVSVLHDNFGLVDPVTIPIGSLNLDHVGLGVAAMLVIVWARAVGYWRPPRSNSVTRRSPDTAPDPRIGRLNQVPAHR